MHAEHRPPAVSIYCSELPSLSVLSVTRIRWWPKLVDTGPWTAPRALSGLNTTLSNCGTICPGRKVPRLPPLACSVHPGRAAEDKNQQQ